ncbi:MAG: hypothetical protein GY941_00895 [Planctomycetes bacterium]|nr:hypothetical protein [Planctomycetota bacterium]
MKRDKDTNRPDRKSATSGSENDVIQPELLEGFGEGRRGFLKKILISSAYITPIVLSYTIKDVEASKGKGKGKGPTGSSASSASSAS